MSEGAVCSADAGAPGLADQVSRPMAPASPQAVSEAEALRDLVVEQMLAWAEDLKSGAVPVRSVIAGLIDVSNDLSCNRRPQAI